jgi:hypothetical protein
VVHTDVVVAELGAYNADGHVNKCAVDRILVNAHALAVDLHELHIRTGISLDHWDNARLFVEAHLGVTVIPNNA